MRKAKRVVIGTLGVLMLVFGLACLNYTKAEGIEHHKEAARRLGLPGPSPVVFYLGVLSVAAGAGVIGFAVGKGRGYQDEARNPKLE